MFERLAQGEPHGADSTQAPSWQSAAATLLEPYSLMPGLRFGTPAALLDLEIEQSLAEGLIDDPSPGQAGGLRPAVPGWRPKLPAALLLSLLGHLSLAVFFAIRLGLDETVPTAVSEPQPIPIRFNQPVIVKPHQFRFPHARKAKQKVRADIKSDQDRKAQSRTPAMAAAGQAQPAPITPSEAARPAPESRPDVPLPELGPAPAASSPRMNSPLARPADPSKTRFDEQYEKMAPRPSLLNPGLGSASVGPEEGEEAGGPQGGLTFDTESDLLGPYGRILVQRVHDAWFVPQMASIASGVTEVQFSIAKDGTLLDPRITQSCGWPGLDAAALNAVKGAVPLPPLPAEFPGPRVGITFRFSYNMAPPGQLRRQHH